jgi:hypothetical protein
MVFQEGFCFTELLEVTRRNSLSPTRIITRRILQQQKHSRLLREDLQIFMQMCAVAANTDRGTECDMARFTTNRHLRLIDDSFNNTKNVVNYMNMVHIYMYQTLSIARDG